MTNSIEPMTHVIIYCRAPKLADIVEGAYLILYERELTDERKLILCKLIPDCGKKNDGML